MLRRDFLSVAGAAVVGARAARSSILIRLDGGASHVDSFDPKAASSPFRAIRTSVPGIHICEHLPLTARLAHKYTIVRSMCSGDTNHERASAILRPTATAMVAVAGLADSRYGATPMGREFLKARRMIAAGASQVTVSGGRLRWDTHRDNFPRLRDELLPELDRAFSALIDDLDASGLLATTLVVMTGEFGRTPAVNEAGGRDHHSGAWSAVVAGAGLAGGRVIGATDRYGNEVTDAAVTPRDLLKAMTHIMQGVPAGVLA
ncbi:MAG TPA: DUF1501 domain-containing protein [Bryobacteraceae bacterium]|nr:DUF1501 domain-containing protein [Bryobacteraceae bacterium]